MWWLQRGISVLNPKVRIVFSYYLVSSIVIVCVGTNRDGILAKRRSGHLRSPKHDEAKTWPSRWTPVA